VRTRLLVAAAAVLFLALLLFGGLAVMHARESRDPFYGTFASEEMSPQKWVTFPGGFKSYVLMSDALPADEGTERIVERWTDAEGNLWYRTQATINGKRNLLTLVRISKSGTVREFTANEVTDFSRKDFPTAFPRAGSYTWYRLPGLLRP
jgi:hypothetical protein